MSIATTTPATREAVGGHVAWRLLRLALRGMRTGLVLVAVMGVFFVSVGAKAFDSAGGGPQLAVLANSPSLRALLGVPWDLSTRGGFVFWRMTAFLALAAAIWALLATTRLLRGYEDLGLTEQLLAGRIRRRSWLLAVLGATWVAGAVLAVAVVLACLAARLDVGPAVLYGVAVGLGLVTFGTVGALCAQVMPQRRSAGGLAAIVTGAFFVIRMAADAASSWGALRWATPFGWIESARAFEANRWVALLPLVAAPLLLGWLSTVLLQRRDLGAGLWQSRRLPPTRLGGLSTAWGYAVRRRARELRWWLPAVLAVALLYGYLAGQVVDFINTDAGYRRLIEQLGLRDLVTVEGYVSVMVVLLSIAALAYPVVVVHGDSEDEGEGRLDLTYAAAVTRDRWLGALVGSAVIGALLISLVSGIGIGLGAWWGGGSVSVGDAVSAVVATWPVVIALVGVCVVLLGWWPRRVGSVGALVAGVWLLIELFGPALDWPDAVIRLTPYDHIGSVPVTGFDVVGSLAVSALGLLVGAVGWAAYRRRDLM